MNKDILKKLERQLVTIKNTKSDYENFIKNFTDLIGDDPELLNWINETYK